MHHPILVLMGPTGSGKSALGIAIAKALDAVIINADALQCYAPLPILTAQPTTEEQAHAPHALYGIWSASFAGNTAHWQKHAIRAIHAAHAQGKLPILLGGSGMYIKTLMEGIAPVPEIPVAIHRLAVSHFQASQQTMYRELQQRDPVTAAKLEPFDKQRVVRAWEVLEATGIPLSTWQEEPVETPFSPQQFHISYMDIPRELLYARINARFEHMMERGALTEVAAILPILEEEPILPIGRAHGVPELSLLLQERMARDAAIEQAQRHTRNYAKRQMTWLRGQCSGAEAVPYDLLERPPALHEWLNTLAKRLDRPVVSQ